MRWLFCLGTVLGLETYFKLVLSGTVAQQIGPLGRCAATKQIVVLSQNEVWQRNNKEVSKLKLISRLIKDESGQGMVEYGLIIAVVALVALVGLTAFGDDLAAFFTGLGARLQP